jgi:hypothetical protein
VLDAAAALAQHWSLAQWLTCGVDMRLQAERQRLAAIPGMINQNQPEAQEMNDA